jgi:hypothetical protein
MPDCEYFDEGSCSKDDCAYRHVKFSSDTKRCDDFLNGFCPMGRSCKSRHLLKSAFETRVKKKEKSKFREDNLRDTLRRRVGDDDVGKAGATPIITATYEKHLESLEPEGAAGSQIFNDEFPLDKTETDLFIPFPDFGDLMGVDSDPDSDSETLRRGSGSGAGIGDGRSDGDCDEGAEAACGKDGDIDGAGDGDFAAIGEDLDLGYHSESETASDDDLMDVVHDEIHPNGEGHVGEEESSVRQREGASPTSVAISSTERISGEREGEYLVQRSSCDGGAIEQENNQIVAELKTAKIFDLLPTSFLYGSEPDLR